MSRALLCCAIVLLLILGVFAGLTATAAAAGSIYVRPGGDDTSCNGTANVDFSVGSAPDCAVKTIGKGVSLVDPSGTVQVAAGTYPESVTITKSLTLNGAQTGVDSRARSGGESVVNSIAISGVGHVTLDGFSFPGNTNQVSVTSPSVLAGIVVQNGIFSGYSSVGLTTYDAGDILIQHNLFQNPSGTAEAMQLTASLVPGGCDGSRVLQNVFSAATNNGGADVNLSCTDSGSSSVTVADNASSGNSGGSSFVAFSGVVDGIAVTGNTATTDGSSIFFFGAVSGTALIDGNSIDNGAGSAISIHDGEYTSDPVNTGTFTITGNQLRGNHIGLYVAPADEAVVAAHFNEFVGNSAAGIENDSANSLDATNNWWGCNDGPNAVGCDASVGFVASDPWLTLTIAADPAAIAPAGNPNDSSTITASLSTNSDTADTSGAGHVLDGTPVAFSTSGGVLSSTSATTVGGSAGVTLSASPLPDTATVSATVDQQTVSTAVDWSAPASTPGAHVVATNNRDPRLNLNVNVNPQGRLVGHLDYDTADFSFESTDISAAVVSGDQATVYGLGRFDDGTGPQTVTFRVEVTANGPHTGESVELILSNGYDSGVVDVIQAQAQQNGPRNDR